MGEIANSLVGDNVHYLLKALCTLSIYRGQLPASQPAKSWSLPYWCTLFPQVLVAST